MTHPKQRLVAEAFGTFTLVLVGAGSVLANSFSRGSVGLVGIALAHGLTILAMVYVFGRISGAHFNPAVTFAMWVTKRLDSKWSALYVLAQLVGATAAGLVLRALMPAQAALLHNGATVLASRVTLGQGILAEALITFILVAVIFGVAVDPKNESHHTGLVIGLTITLLILLAGPLTGAAINPARAFGPALSSGFFTNNWVYWVGPLLGGGLAGLLYQVIFLKDNSK